MPWVQYTRNFEDVILHRVFQHIDRGCFLDVGAFDPVNDSNTYALYERGWRGIAVEALADAGARWAEMRPEDIFVAAAAGSRPGTREFVIPPDALQAATTEPRQAETLQRLGLSLVKRTVPVTTLDAVLEQHLGARPLHVLSLDVEGSEAEALKGLDLTRFRPWLLLIEATLPGSPVPAHQEWEPLVLGRGYDLAYFDGVNRFYLAQEHAELRQHFTLPPNVWDDFVSHRIVELERALAEARRQR